MSQNKIVELPLIPATNPRNPDYITKDELDSYLSSYLSSYLARARVQKTCHSATIPEAKTENNSTTTVKSPYNGDLSVDLSPITEAYENFLHRPMPRSYLSFVAYYVARGLEVEVVVDILSRTADAPRPSWAYAKAVIERCYSEGVRTIKDMEERDEQRRNEFRALKSKPEKGTWLSSNTDTNDDSFYYDVFQTIAESQLRSWEND